MIILNCLFLVELIRPTYLILATPRSAYPYRANGVRRSRIRGFAVPFTQNTRLIGRWRMLSKISKNSIYFSGICAFYTFLTEALEET